MIGFRVWGEGGRSLCSIFGMFRKEKAVDHWDAIDHQLVVEPH